VEVSTEEFPRPLTAAGARATSATESTPYPPDVRDEEIAMVLDAEFPIALRGYERAAVDGYVRRVSRVIAELEASRSPQSAIRYALEQVGEQTRAILQQANDSADEITSRSRAEADERVQRAEREAEQMKVDAERRLVEIEDDIADLWQERQRLLEDMRDVSLRMHDAVVTASERQPPPPVLPEDEEETTEVGETHPIEAERPFLTAVPPPPEDADPEPMLADAPPPLAEDAAGPLAFEEEPPLGAMDEPAAPVAEEDSGATQPFDPVSDWEEEDAADEQPMRLELQADEEQDEDSDDDDDTVER
jgi:uncharacterized protein with HEPN domain